MKSAMKAQAVFIAGFICSVDNACMPRRPRRRILTVAALGALVCLSGAPAGAARRAPTFTHPTRIDNPYLPLSKFRRCTLRGHEDRQRQRIKRRVLDRTRTFDVGGKPVETMVVKDRVRADGKLIEEHARLLRPGRPRAPFITSASASTTSATGGSSTTRAAGSSDATRTSSAR